MVVVSALSAANCMDRLAGATGERALPASRILIRGWAKGREFRIARNAGSGIPLRTEIAGRIRSSGDGAAIELSIGPNPVLALPLIVLASLLIAAALVATITALASGGAGSGWHGVPLSWMVVFGFSVQFFVVPAESHRFERAFLLEYLRRTLDTVPGERR